MKSGVTSINDAPVATFTTLTLQEDTNKTATLTATDIDNNDTLTFSIVAQPQNGTLNLERNGSFVYTPNQNFNGSDSFTYKVNDGIVDSLIQRVAITVTSINDAPTPTFTTLRVQEDTTKRATLTAIDVDSNSSSLTFSIATQPQHATINLETNGSFSYTPDPNFNGSDFFSYKVSDGTDDSVEQNVTIIVKDTNDAPFIDTHFPNITIKDRKTKKLLINIRDLDGDVLTLNIESNSSRLTISKNFTNPILQADYTNKILDFNITSDDNFTGSVRVTIILSDGDENTSKSFIVNAIKGFKSEIIRWKGLIYKTVVSPHTGRVWLDRNLGAIKVCGQAYGDTDCYGDYYQWGREADGHEKVNSETTTNTAQNLTDANIKGKFVVNSENDYDWGASFDRNGSIRSANWQKTDGSSVCPIGFRVPTLNELSYEAERFAKLNDKTHSLTAFNSFLKFPQDPKFRKLDGSLDTGEDIIIDIFYSSYVWPSDVPNDILGYKIKTLYYVTAFDSIMGSASMNINNGFSIRCIKDN